MAATPALQVLTANRLRDGDVVYWQGGAWIDIFADADVFCEKALADAALAAAMVFVKDRVVVNPYLFAVRDDDGKFHAVEQREIIRSEGPSVRRDLGKQARPSMEAFDVSI
jgi:sulfite reductase (NADPH) hemoprotein beta-component